MSDQDANTPRVFIVRHGETEWAKSGRFTGTTEINLTLMGIKQVESTARVLVGAGKLLDPSRLARVFVSPRKRAMATLDLLLPPESRTGLEVTVTEDITEWNYGDYEGKTDLEIRESRKERKMDQERSWSIWRDGCEGGESKNEITDRLDRLIERIRDIQKPHMNDEKPANMLLVAHGLILRCFVKRWIGHEVDDDLPMTMTPGAIAILSYAGGDINKPNMQLGAALPTAPPAEDGCM